MENVALKIDPLLLLCALTVVRGEVQVQRRGGVVELGEQTFTAATVVATTGGKNKIRRMATFDHEGMMRNSNETFESSLDRSGSKDELQYQKM